MEFKGLPGIEDYLASQGDGFPVEVPELDHILDEIVSHTVLTRDQAKRICSMFFQEIRSAILRGEVVDIRGLGSFSISSPATSGNKNTFVKFRPKKSIIRKLNGKQ